MLFCVFVCVHVCSLGYPLTAHGPCRNVREKMQSDRCISAALWKCHVFFSSPAPADLSFSLPLPPTRFPFHLDRHLDVSRVVCASSHCFHTHTQHRKSFHTQPVFPLPVWKGRCLEVAIVNSSNPKENKREWSHLSEFHIKNCQFK